jgi:hypothetical protein
MRTVQGAQRRATPLDRLFFETPCLWHHHPFLPVVRYLPDGVTTQCGLLYDALGASGLEGFATTVFLCNLFALPATEADFLARPRCVYDSISTLAADGWFMD